MVVFRIKMGKYCLHYSENGMTACIILMETIVGKGRVEHVFDCYNYSEEKKG